MRGLLLLLLLVLIAGGGYNYYRNAPLDEELESRPYAKLSDSELETMIRAYEDELARATHNLNGPPDGDWRMRGYAPSDLGGKLEAFDRYQDAAQAWKSRYHRSLEHKGQIELLHKEQEIRAAGLHKAWRRALRRLITL